LAGQTNFIYIFTLICTGEDNFAKVLSIRKENIMNTTTSRRNFFKKTLATVAIVPFMGEAFAKACVMAAAPVGKKVLALTDKAAKRLKYILDATKSTHKKYKAGDACGNCKFYKLKKEASGHAPCSMMGNKYVTTCGWCKSYRLDKKKV